MCLTEIIAAQFTDRLSAVLRKNSVVVEKTEVEAGGMMVVDWDGGSVDNLIDGPIRSTTSIPADTPTSPKLT